MYALRRQSCQQKGVERSENRSVILFDRSMLLVQDLLNCDYVNFLYTDFERFQWNFHGTMLIRLGCFAC
jgi:hypothetical protein